MKNTSYEVSVLVNGKPVKEYEFEGNTYIEGRKGSDFELKFKNNSSKKVLVVPSVDGLSVLDGNQANAESDGYVINAYGNITIPGWRLNNNSVAQFFFQSKQKSYSEASGAGSANVGVIGFMIFEERAARIAPQPQYPSYPPAPWARPTWIRDDYTYRDTGMLRGFDNRMYSMGASATLSASNAAPSAAVDFCDDILSSASVDEKSYSLGTGFGREVENKVVEVNFEKKSTSPDALFVIHYDSKKNLEAKGIVFKKHKVEVTPNPFPGYINKGCNPPAGWRG